MEHGLSFISQEARQQHYSYDFMMDAVHAAQDAFVQRRQEDSLAGKRTYNIEFDSVAYQTAYQFRFQNPEAYQEVLDHLNSRTIRNIEKHLGERLHVGDHSYGYDIGDDGLLYAEDNDEPVIEMFERGVTFRRQNGNSVDWEREDAELAGFRNEVQGKLPVADDKEMRLSISLPGGKGSNYNNNFYDIHMKVGGKIKSRRFSSALNAQEYVTKLKEIGLLNEELESNPTAENFLAHPIKVDPKTTGFETPDDIHAFLHKAHTYMTKQEFDEVLRSCQELIASYPRFMTRDPYNTEQQKLIYNAILNKADKVARNLQRRREGKLYEVMPQKTTEEEILNYGMMPVREDMTDCGFSGGYDMGVGVYSVSQFGGNTAMGELGVESDGYGPLEFMCPSCRLLIKRPKNTLLSNCSMCGSDKIACKEPEKSKKKKEENVIFFPQKKEDKAA